MSRGVSEGRPRLSAFQGALMPLEHLYRITLNIPEDVAAVLAHEAHRYSTTVQVVAQAWLMAGSQSVRTIEAGAREN